MQRKQSDSPERYDNNECTNVFSISQNKENRKLNDLKEPNSKECNIVISLNASDNKTMEQTEPVKIDTISPNDIHPNKKVNFLGKKQYPKKTKPFFTIKEDEDQKHLAPTPKKLNQGQKNKTQKRNDYNVTQVVSQKVEHDINLFDNLLNQQIISYVKNDKDYQLINGLLFKINDNDLFNYSEYRNSARDYDNDFCKRDKVFRDFYNQQFK